MAVTTKKENVVAIETNQILRKITQQASDRIQTDFALCRTAYKSSG